MNHDRTLTTSADSWLRANLPDAPVFLFCPDRLAETAAAYLHAFASNLVSAAIRLSVLGQTEGQAVIRALAPLCSDLARRALEADLTRIGTFSPLADIASQRHEALYSRIFRS